MRAAALVDVVYVDGFPPLMVPPGGMREWPCKCLVATGWDLPSLEPGIVMAGCPAHDVAMRRAHDVAHAMIHDPVPPTGVDRATPMLDVLVGIVMGQDGHP